MWLALIPLAAFLTAFCAGAVGLWYLAKRTKFSRTQTTSGESIHVENSIGTLDVHPEAKLDPRLAQLPIYPGALPDNALGPEVVTELHLAGKSLRSISATYWSIDPASQIWEFYRQALPAWPRNLDSSLGRELIHRESDHVRLIRITTRGDRTVIETSIKSPNYPHDFGSGS